MSFRSFSIYSNSYKLPFYKNSISSRREVEKASERREKLPDFRYRLVKDRNHTF